MICKPVFRCRNLWLVSQGTNNCQQTWPATTRIAPSNPTFIGVIALTFEFCFVFVSSILQIPAASAQSQSMEASKQEALSRKACTTWRPKACPSSSLETFASDASVGAQRMCCDGFFVSQAQQKCRCVTSELGCTWHSGPMERGRRSLVVRCATKALKPYTHDDQISNKDTRNMLPEWNCPCVEQKTLQAKKKLTRTCAASMAPSVNLKDQERSRQSESKSQVEPES